MTSSVQDDLHDSSFSSSRIHRYINRGQELIFNTHLFKFCEEVYSDSASAAASTIAQQADHQATMQFVLTSQSNTDQHYVFGTKKFMQSEAFFEKYPLPANNTAGVPVNWTEFGGTIYLSCPLDDTYTFTQRYYRIPTELSGASDVPDVPSTFRDLLETYALYRSEKYRGNHDIAATYRQDFEDGLENMAIRFSSIIAGLPTAVQYRTRVGDAD